MQWDHDAETRHSLLPIPPMMSSYARLHAEKLARRAGLDRVTEDIVRDTEQAYADFMGREKTQEFKAFMAGTGPAPTVEDELFFSADNAMYHVDVCFTKYGENSQLVRDALKDMLKSITGIMEEEHLTELMADRAPSALHGANRFTVGMTGCPNCCVSPHMKDLGIIMQHRVEITDAACTMCGECLKMCIEKAIRLTDTGPDIDRTLCVQCELCARDCPTGKLGVTDRGWRVIAGGGGGHHPALAVTVEDFTTKDRVLQILRNAIAALRSAPPGESLRTIVQRQGSGVFR
jgi:anaerobic sulfite reductase subunit C